MPYRHANYFVGFVLLVIVVGFWDSYFTKLATASLAFHVHAISSILWVGLLMLQGWSIHNRRNDLHKTLGKASLALFPVLILGFVMIINVSAERYANAESPFIQVYGPAFGIGMAMAILAYLVLYYQALKNRRNIKLHAGYMLMTPAVLFESPFSRIWLDVAPQTLFTPMDDPMIVMRSITASMGIAAVFSLILYARYRKHGTPFLVAAALITVQATLMYLSPSLDFMATGFEAYTRIPEPVTLIGGLLLGAVAAWLGWQSQKPRTPTPMAKAA